MPRQLAERTTQVWRYVQPLSSAAEILAHMQDSGIVGVNIDDVNNALRAGIRSGHLLREKLGRIGEKVWRYVLSRRGINEMQERYGMPVTWSQSAGGIKSLAGKIELVEMAYIFPRRLWQSNLVRDSRCYVYRRMMVGVWRNGVLDGEWQIELRESDWSGARLRETIWLENGPFEAMLIYDDGRGGDALLYLPLLWRTDYQVAAQTAHLIQDMMAHLVEDERWRNLPKAQSEDIGYRPGAIVFSPGRVPAAMAQRHWMESWDRNNATNIGILDAEGQVVRQMVAPTAWWSAFEPPAFNGPLGDIEGVVAGLKTGGYAAVNGQRQWRVFRSVDRSPSVKIEHMAASAKLKPRVAAQLVEPMKAAGVIEVWNGGHFVNEPGRDLLENSQGASKSEVNNRWGPYTRPKGKLRSRNHIHNEGQADGLMHLNDHGHSAFPALGIVIQYRIDGQLIRIDPDGFVVLEPGVLSAIEYERHAKTDTDLLEKIGVLPRKRNGVRGNRPERYAGLLRVGRPMPTLYIMETDEAARRVAEIRCPYIVAASLKAVKEGPHGRAEIIDGVDVGTPGCWWYWYPGEEAPRANAPIDLASHLYLRDYPDSVWQVPVNRPFRVYGP